MSIVRSVEELAALYGEPGEASLVKELDRIIPEYAAFINASPFAALATCGPEGLDCSPRGDFANLVRIEDERTLLMPDRRGNNRTDSMKNIIRDPRVAVLFLVPGSGTTLRVNGYGEVHAGRELCASFAVDGKAPRSVIVIKVHRVYFQCARAIHRSDLWNPARHVAPSALPSAGAMLAAVSRGEVGGADYDAQWPERAKATMW